MFTAYPDEKVTELEKAVLGNDIEQVQLMLAKPGKLEFTARAVGLAMRFCGVDMVRALLDGGASLSYTMTPELAGRYGCRFSASYQTDYSKYMFAAIAVPEIVDGQKSNGETADREVISEEARLDVIRCLVERNIPTLHTFLYYSILSHDMAVTDYLKSHRVNALPAPYADIVAGSVPSDQMTKTGLYAYEDELRQVLRSASDTEMAWSLSEFAACTGSRIPAFRYRILDLARACSEDLLEAAYTLTDISRHHRRLDIMHYVVDTENIPALKYILEHKWLKNDGDREYLLDYARNAKKPSPEAVSVILGVVENQKDQTCESEVDGLSLEDKLLTLGEVRKTWGCRKIGEGEYEIFSYKSTRPNAVIPSQIKPGTITSIDPGTFRTSGPGIDPRMAKSRAELTSVEIPGSIKTIPGELFAEHKKLKSVVLGYGVQNIGRNAFSDCPALEEVALPASVRSIDAFAFDGCTSLKELHLPEELTYMGVEAFFGTALKTVTIPAKLETVSRSAFGDTSSLKEVRFAKDADGHSALRTIEAGAFAGSGIESLILPAETKSIGDSAFLACEELKHICVPETTQIGDSAFCECDNLANEQGEIVVNGILFGVAGDRRAEDRVLEDEQLLKPVLIGDDIRRIGTDLHLLPEIVYRAPAVPSPVAAEMSRCSPGALVSFGRFPQDTDLQLKPITWKVLEQGPDAMLLITEKCIMADSFFEDDMFQDTVTIWADCKLRALLNGPFLDIAFNASERALIKSVELLTASRSGRCQTTDRVFLLSMEEYDRYRKQTLPIAYPTKYAVAQSNPDYVNGRRDGMTTDTFAPWILRAYDDWEYVDEYMSGQSFYYLEDADIYTDQMFVRPAMWVRTSNKSGCTSKQGGRKRR